MSHSPYKTTSNPTSAREARQWGELGSWAPYYDLVMRLMTLGRERKLRQMTLDLCPIRYGDRLLEVGCGTGTLALAAKTRVGTSGEVFGIDLAPEMVEVARRKASQNGGDVSFRQGSIASIPFPNDHFDVVLCSFMIFHMPDVVRQAGIAELARVLKSNGHLCVLDSAPLDELAVHLREHSFVELSMQQAKFSVMKLQFLCAKVSKA